MTTYKTNQRRLTRQGREFHFVSTEGVRANPARGIEEEGPMWCLMSAGKRWPVMPEVPGADEAAVDAQLLDWIDANMTAPDDESGQ